MVDSGSLMDLGRAVKRGKCMEEKGGGNRGRKDGKMRWCRMQEDGRGEISKLWLDVRPQIKSTRSTLKSGITEREHVHPSLTRCLTSKTLLILHLSTILPTPCKKTFFHFLALIFLSLLYALSGSNQTSNYSGALRPGQCVCMCVCGYLCCGCKQTIKSLLMFVTPKSSCPADPPACILAGDEEPHVWKHNPEYIYKNCNWHLLADRQTEIKQTKKSSTCYCSQKKKDTNQRKWYT